MVPSSVLRIMILIFFCGFSTFAQAQRITRLKSIEEILEIRKKAIFKVKAYKNGKHVSTGTGFFIDRKGLAITNFHVMYKNKASVKPETSAKAFIDMNTLLTTSNYQYKFTDMKNKDIGSPKVLGCGNKNNLDVCYLKFEKKRVPYIPIDNVKVGLGHKVFSLGHCGGELNVKKGEIKKYHKDFLNYYSITNIKYNHNSKMIEVSNPICPGDSGGPIFNSQGNLVGITTIRFSKNVQVDYTKSEVKWWRLGITIDEVKSVKKSKGFRVAKYERGKKKVRRPADPFDIP
jgi:S1-C subfamily serine protease